MNSKSTPFTISQNVQGLFKQNSVAFIIFQQNLHRLYDNISVLLMQTDASWVGKDYQNSIINDIITFPLSQTNRLNKSNPTR